MDDHGTGTSPLLSVEQFSCVEGEEQIPVLQQAPSYRVNPWFWNNMEYHHMVDVKTYWGMTMNDSCMCSKFA